MSPQVDLNAVRVHFMIIGERPKYHVTAKDQKTGKSSCWRSTRSI